MTVISVNWTANTVKIVGLCGLSRYSERMRILILSLALFCLSLATAAETARAESLAGTATVVDGNHIEVQGEKIKLLGIDAPDLEQTCTTRKGKTKFCGQLAKQYLARLLENRKVKCTGDKRGPKGHLLAICIIGPFRVNEQMVMNGWALADPVTGELYKRAELFAQIRKEGMWRGKFENPWVWRQGR